MRLCLSRHLDGFLYVIDWLEDECIELLCCAHHIFMVRENLPGHFKFKEYCPRVFHDLRKRFEVDDYDYMVSCTCTVCVYMYVHV